MPRITQIDVLPFTAFLYLAGDLAIGMSKRMPSKNVFTVALSILLLLSTAAVGSVAAVPADSDALNQTDAQETTDGDTDLTAAEIIEKHEQRVESLETVSATIHTNHSSSNYSSSPSTSSIWINFTDKQMRTEYSSKYGDTTTIRNESGSVTYNAEENTVSESDITFSDMNPAENGFFGVTVTDQAELTNEGTEVLNGTETYRLDADYQTEDNETEQDSIIWINAETYMPVQYEVSIESEHSSYESTVQFNNVSINETISDERFNIDIPDDAEQPNYSKGYKPYDSENELRQNASQPVPEPELPDGYTFGSGYTADGEFRSSVSLTYTNGEDKSVTITQYNSTTNTSYYSESDAFETVSIGNQTGYYRSYSDEPNTSVLIWTNGDRQYTIYGPVSQSTVTAIAESMA